MTASPASRSAAAEDRAGLGKPAPDPAQSPVATLTHVNVFLRPNPYVGYMTEETAVLRRQAERCRRLARETSDRTTAVRLLELADEYDARAAELIEPGTDVA